MTNSIPAFLASLQMGEPSFNDNLAVVPLVQDQASSLSYLTLQEGLPESLLEVEELEDGAEVNDILFRNKSDKYALLFEGEEFLGAMQNRILNISILVKQNSEQKIPVSCVEAGRWQHEHSEQKKQRFSVADRFHYARGRALGNRAVTRNLRSSKTYRADQSEVWHDIDLKSQRLKTASPTAASEAMYASSESTLDDHVKSFEPVENQVGSVFLVDGEVSGIEIFASEKTHKDMFQRLIRSYGLDAVDSRRSSPQEQVEETPRAKEDFQKSTEAFIRRLSNSAVDEFEGVCLGQNLRFDGEAITGGALIHDDRVLHLSALAA